MNMIRKGQVQGVDKGDVRASTRVSVSTFWHCTGEQQGLKRIPCPQIVFATQPNSETFMRRVRKDSGV